MPKKRSAGESLLAQQARNVADRRLREENRTRFYELMTEEYEARGLVYKVRPTPEEAEAQREAERVAKAKAKIVALAESAGLAVLVREPIEEEAAVMANPQFYEEIRRTSDGTEEPVELDRTSL